MLEMARLGAGVMQPRAVEMGFRYGVPITYVQHLVTIQVLLFGRIILWKQINT